MLSHRLLCINQEVNYNIRGHVELNFVASDTDTNRKPRDLSFVAGSPGHYSTD